MTHPTNPTRAGQTAEPLFLSPLEAAGMLGVSRAKIYDLVAAGSLQAWRVGTSIRIPRRAIQELVDQIMAEAG